MSDSRVVVYVLYSVIFLCCFEVLMFVLCFNSIVDFVFNTYLLLCIVCVFKMNSHLRTHTSTRTHTHTHTHMHTHTHSCRGHVRTSRSCMFGDKGGHERGTDSEPIDCLEAVGGTGY